MATSDMIPLATVRDETNWLLRTYAYSKGADSDELTLLSQAIDSSAPEDSLCILYVIERLGVAATYDLFLQGGQNALYDYIEKN